MGLLPDSAKASSPFGIHRRKRAVVAVQAYESEALLHQEQMAVVQMLQPLQRPFRADVVEELCAWVAQYCLIDSCYKFQSFWLLHEHAKVRLRSRCINCGQMRFRKVPEYRQCRMPPVRTCRNLTGKSMALSCLIIVIRCNLCSTNELCFKPTQISIGLAIRKRTFIHIKCISDVCPS